MLPWAPAWAETVHVLAVNDLHGRVEETGRNVGMPRLAGFIKGYRLEHPESLVVAAGDNYQGGALSNLSRGAVVNALYREVGLAVSAVGNHEFDWGVELFEAWARQGVGYVAANIRQTGTGRGVPWAVPYRILNAGRRRIAFIGLTTTDTPRITSPRNVAGLIFDAAARTARQWVAYLEDGRDSAGKPDAVILLTHIPSFQDPATGIISGYELAGLTRVKGVDAVITGHSHQRVCGDLNGIAVVQARCYGQAVALLDLDFRGNERVRVTPHLIELDAMGADLTADPAATAILGHYARELGPVIHAQVGFLADALPSDRSRERVATSLGCFACDIMRRAAGTEVALLNTGALRKGLGPGPVTVADVYEALPFDDAIYTCQIKGEDLRRILTDAFVVGRVGGCQFAGLILRLHAPADGTPSRLEIRLADGTPLENARFYSLAIPDYLYAGGDGYDFRSAREARNTGLYLRDLVIDHLRRAGPVTVPPVSQVFIRTGRPQ